MKDDLSFIECFSLVGVLFILHKQFELKDLFIIFGNTILFYIINRIFEEWV